MVTIIGLFHRAATGFLLAALAGMGALAFAAAPAAGRAGSAVMLMYHRFGDMEIPSASIRLDQFDAHIETLAAEGYTVLPAGEIVARLKRGESVPDFTVGITIDDAHVSVYREAWPRLRRARLPFTLFVATDLVDARGANTLNWDEIRELARAGVTIGNHGAAHHRPLAQTNAKNMEEILRASRRIEEETGEPPKLFAYPYGEYDADLRERLRKSGLEAAFGQHSGVVHAGEDFFSLPRFTLNEEFGGLDRFKLITRTLPLAVTDVTPTSPHAAMNPPLFGFTVTEDLPNLSDIACYGSGKGKASTEKLGARRIEVRFSEPFPPGRLRVNCTLRDASGRWRWYGAQFLLP